MKHSFLFLFFIVINVIAFSQGKEKEVWFNESYRPQYHFTPLENRMGAPISLVQTDSTYHLFYQWNPHNLQQGFVNWGYATSYDLLRWKHQGIALSQPEGVADSMMQTPWWGTVAQKGDQQLAWVTSWGEGIFRYNNFLNGKWTGKEKTTGVEALTKSDPYVFWHEKTNKWVMVNFNRADSSIHLLNSPDGLAWKETSTFNFNYGFASLTELLVDSTEDTRWMFYSETGIYIIGKFDGEKFEVQSPLTKFDNGRNIGGSIIFNDQKKNRHLLLSEVKSEQHPDLPSNGQLTFPVELSLQQKGNDVELIRKPASEIEKLYRKNYLWDNKKIYPGVNNNLLQALKGESYHLKGTIDLKNCDVFGIMIRSNRENIGIDCSYNVSRGLFEIEGSRINYRPTNNKIEFEILVDRSSVELFVDGGRYLISTSIVPEPKNLRYLLYTIGGEIMVEHFEAHELKSAWRDEK
jgi:sucrose-6-phosphate hydrolase SacC (GH32 family)